MYEQLSQDDARVSNAVRVVLMIVPCTLSYLTTARCCNLKTTCLVHVKCTCIYYHLKPLLKVWTLMATCSGAGAIHTA